MRLSISLLLAIVCFFPHSTKAASLAIAGDSMACHYYSDTTAKGWGMEMPDVFQNISINNFAGSGSSTLSFFNGALCVDDIPAGQPNSRHRWANLLSSNPNYVLISFGWNDKNAVSDPERYCTIPQYQGNLSTMIDDARSIGATPILLTSPTARYFNTDGSVYNDMRDYCDAMIEVATENSVPVIDLNYLLLNVYQLFGPTAAPLFGYNTEDHLHFGEYGAKQVARLIANEISTACPALATYLVPGGNQLVFANGGSELTLNPSGACTINAPVLIQDDVCINGTGTVNFNGGIQGDCRLTVQAGTIIATSICVDTLSIGSGGMLVPEPSALIMMLTATLGGLLCLHRRS
jgi:lysophospholipase L1-like esterase